MPRTLGKSVKPRIVYRKILVSEAACTRALRSVSNKNKTDSIESVCFCEKRDLNPYGVNHTPLKRARLPVPPLSRICFCVLVSRTSYIILQVRTFVNTFF